MKATIVVDELGNILSISPKGKIKAEDGTEMEYGILIEGRQRLHMEDGTKMLAGEGYDEKRVYEDVDVPDDLMKDYAKIRDIERLQDILKIPKS